MALIDEVKRSHLSHSYAAKTGTHVLRGWLSITSLVKAYYTGIKDCKTLRIQLDDQILQFYHGLSKSDLCMIDEDGNALDVPQTKRVSK